MRAPCLPSIGEPCGDCHRCRPPLRDILARIIVREIGLTPEEAESMHFEAADAILAAGFVAQADWVDWLAVCGYGIDYSHDNDPPCSLYDLAEAYARTDLTGETVGSWECVIRDNTGALGEKP